MKVRFTLSIGFSGAEHDEIVEIPDKDLVDLTDEEKTEYLDSYYLEWRNNYLDGWWEIIQ